MEDLKTIADNILNICYDVDRNIGGISEIEAKLWARSHSIRHAHTIRTILKYIEKNKIDSFKILNASGLSTGNQDFAIVNYLRNTQKLNFEWVVFESPKCKFIQKNLFKKYIKDLKIHMELSDFSQTEVKDLFGTENEKFDVVIFTDIIEHLDHTTFLNALKAIRLKMKDNAILIITTPNLVSLPHRIRILFGKGSLNYFGDGTLNLEEGIYGHINYFDITRLTRLLNDVGFHVRDSYSFTFGHGPGEQYFSKRILFRLNDFVTLFFKYAKTTIFIEAVKSEPIKIPLILPSQK
jgi:hypothetical protein